MLSSLSLSREKPYFCRRLLLDGSGAGLSTEREVFFPFSSLKSVGLSVRMQWYSLYLSSHFRSVAVGVGGDGGAELVASDRIFDRVGAGYAGLKCDCIFVLGDIIYVVSGDSDHKHLEINEGALLSRAIYSLREWVADFPWLTDGDGVGQVIGKTFKVGGGKQEVATAPMEL